MDGARTALCVEMAASIVDQDPAHHLSGDSEEMRAVVPLNISLIDKTDERFVHQRGRLECVACALAVHVVMGQPVKLAVNQRG